MACHSSKMRIGRCGCDFPYCDSETRVSRYGLLVSLFVRRMKVLRNHGLIGWWIVVVFLVLNGLAWPANAGDISKLPVLNRAGISPPTSDYLLDGRFAQAAVYQDPTAKTLILDNGLIQRSWRLQPNGACVAFDNLMTGQSMLRSVRPEARVTIDGVRFDVGGLIGQPNHAYLTPDWLETMSRDQAALQFIDFEVSQPIERLKWGRTRHAQAEANWPPKGIHLRLDFAVGDSPSRTATKATDFVVSVHYEMYDGIPVITKWISIQNNTKQTITLDRFTAEELAIVEYANWVETRGNVDLPTPDVMHVETDFAFGGFNYENANRHVVHWRADPLFSTQVNYTRETPCLLVVEPTYGPAQEIQAGNRFESFHLFELIYDSSDRERRGLALRRMYRTLAPWVTENPITHHLINSNPDVVRRAIDQAAEVGFEAVIMSFGSGFNMESTDPDYLSQWKETAEYAQQKGVELGSYSLFSSRRIGGGNDIVSPAGQKPTHNHCPAATSEWGRDYYAKLQAFYEFTGFDQFENDGPYPGDVDVTPRPPYQKGEQDSRWAQWKIVVGLYQQLRAQGVYINAPDYYYLSGSNKCGMGYREVNWSLPREHQVIHTRQNIYDGTWTKTPSMGWMFVPLSQYHGGGAAATTEPLSEHLDHYERLLRSNLGMGVQAHYRGPRLYDTPATRDRVKQVVDWFKSHREILESDLIHGRRADGRDLDWVLHVNPQLSQEKGMLCVYNPLQAELARKLRVNLYYTGLSDAIEVRHEGRAPERRELERDYSLELEVKVPASGMTWYQFGPSTKNN